MNEQITSLIKELESEVSLISEGRIIDLSFFAEEINRLIKETGESNVTFVCTHNSRRSQLSEIWLRILAEYYGVKNLKTFSGGTESTAFNHRMVAALRRAGFDLVTKDESVKNPIYTLRDDTGDSPAMFSKKYDDPYNPRKDFIAVMVCSEADTACPFVPGAFSRIALPYVDPKKSDDTDMESVTYDNKVREIGRELIYVAKLISNI